MTRTRKARAAKSVPSSTIARRATREEIEAAIEATPRPTSREGMRRAMERFEADAKPPRLQSANVVNGTLELAYEYQTGIEDGPANRAVIQLQLMEACGTRSIDFLDAVTTELFNLLRNPDGAISPTQLNMATAILASAKPESELEAMLVVQMIATHLAAMRNTRRMMTADYPETLFGLGNLTTKLMRTYTTQMEALAKLRRGGEQVVRHIHVDNRGGQAVFAENMQAGGSKNGSAEQAYGAEAIAGGAALPGADAQADLVSVASHAERAVSDPRR